MKKTLQDQYLLIKEGKGHKGVFLTEAKRQFPNIVRNAATFEEAASSLITKNIIAENVIGTTVVAGYEPKKKESYETAFEAFLAEAKKKEEDEKAELKKPSKQVEEDLSHNFDNSDEKNPDNMIFGQIMMGYYAEMKDPKNSEKTMQELKDMVFKNLSKDPIYYTKNAQFGVKDLGYTDEATALGMPKEAKGKYKGSGYGDLNESFMGSYGDNPHQNEPLDIEDYLEQVEGMSRDEAIEYLGRQGLSSSQALKVISKMDMDVRDMFGQDPDVKIYSADDLYERKLRKVIREMIEGELEEAYQMPSINTANISGGEGGKRFIPTKLPFPVNIRKRFGDHMVFNPVSGTFYISDILYNNLVKGYANQPAIKKLIMDIPQMVKQVLNKPDNYGPIVNLPKEFKVYHPLNAEVEKAKADKFNKAGTKQYWAEGDFLIPNLNVMEGELEEASLGVIDNDVAPAYFKDLPISYNDDKSVAHYSDDYGYDNQDDLLDVEDYLDQIKGMSKGDAFDYLKEMGLERDEILTVLRNHKSSSLRESVEKDLAAINKEAEHEVLQSKMEKIQALIDKKQSQLSKLDEDEDMKSLTDDKKVKEISKDIKALEKAKAKLEKLMGKVKGKKKEVIDEVEGEELDQQTVNGITEKYNAIYEKNGVVTDSDIEKIADQYPFSEKSSIMDYLDGYEPSLEFDI